MHFRLSFFITIYYYLYKSNNLSVRRDNHSTQIWFTLIPQQMNHEVGIIVFLPVKKIERKKCATNQKSHQLWSVDSPSQAARRFLFCFLVPNRSINVHLFDFVGISIRKNVNLIFYGANAHRRWWYLKAIKLYWFSFSVWFILLSKFCATKFNSKPLELPLHHIDPVVGSKKVKEKNGWENVIIFPVGPMCCVAYIAIQHQLLYRTRCCAYIVSHMWVQAIFIVP